MKVIGLLLLLVGVGAMAVAQTDQRAPEIDANSGACQQE